MLICFTGDNGEHAREREREGETEQKTKRYGLCVREREVERERSETKRGLNNRQDTQIIDRETDRQN